MKRLSGPLRGAGVGIVLLVLVCMPFFKGLFFWTELLPAIALVALAFALWIVGRRLGGLSVGVPGGVAGGALLALAGCYALQFAWAVYPRGNLDWLLRVLAGWFVFVIFRAEASERLRRVMAWAFVVGASAVAVHGLVEFTGLQPNYDLLERLSLVGLSARMYTALEYPNTAAVYFLAALFLAVGLGVTSSWAWVKGLTGALGTLLAIGFFFAVSRGAVLVVPFGLIVFFVGLGRERVWAALLLLSAVFLPTLAVVGPIGAAATAKEPGSAFIWVGLAVLGGLLLGTSGWILVRFPMRRQIAIIGILAVLGASALGLARAGQPLLPAQAMRLFDINFKTPNVVLRLTYDKDAVKMVLDRPFGRGGWGWARSYRQYQTFNYTSREVHNHFAQTAVDTGVVGLIALGMAILAGLGRAWQSRDGNPIGWAMASGATLIALHSLVDLNLSFGGIWMLIWAYYGSAVSGQPQGHPRVAAALGTLASAIAVGVTATTLWHSARLGEHATQLVATGKMTEARSAATQAATWDWLNSEAMIQAGDHVMLLRAVRVDPTNPEAWFQLAISHEVRREWQLGLAAARRATEVEPWNTQYLDKVVRLEGFLMLDELVAGHWESALAMAQDLLSVERRWTDRLATAAPDQHLWRVGTPKLDPGTLLRFGQAKFLDGDLDGAKGLLSEAAKVGLLNTEAEVWLYALHEIRGDVAGMRALENQPWVRFRGSNPIYQAIKK